MEGLGTMFLVLTILCTIDEKKGHAASYLQPFAIGIAILVIHIWLVREHFISLVFSKLQIQNMTLLYRKLF